jgi:hypothetical protein
LVFPLKNPHGTNKIYSQNFVRAVRLSASWTRQKLKSSGNRQCNARRIDDYLLQKPVDSTSFAAGKNDVKIFTSLLRGKFTNREIFNTNQTDKIKFLPIARPVFRIV